MGPFGYCKGSGLCSECESGSPGDCVQTSDMSSLTAGRERRVGHILAICGCVTNDPKINSLKLEFTTSFSQVGNIVWLRGLARSGLL